MVLFPVRSHQDWQSGPAGQEQYGNMLSVVIPTLNAVATLAATLASVAAADEVVVADGGSSDGTQTLATTRGARVRSGPARTGAQLAAGVAAAQRRVAAAAARRYAAGRRDGGRQPCHPIAPAISASRWTATIRARDGWSAWWRGAAACWRCRMATRDC